MEQLTMDFHSLSRRELQSLCKKNNIPANITNVAMAQALAALPQVEGLDELDNRFQEPCPDSYRRTSTRRKAVKGIELESKDVNVAVTPAVPTSRRTTAAISTRRKTKPQMLDDEVPKTPASTAPSTATRTYNTRRSVRLLEKKLFQMSLMDTEDMVGVVKIDDMSQDMSNVSQQIQELEETGIGPSMQTVSTVVSDEFEVTSQEKSTEYDLGFGTENAVGAGLQAEPQEGFGEIESLEAELCDSNLKMEESSETYNYSSEVCDGPPDFDINKPTGKAVRTDNQAETGLFVELADSHDYTELETKHSGEPFESPEEDVSEEGAGFSLSIEVPYDASVEVTGQDIVGSPPMSSVSMTDNHDVSDSTEISALSNEISGDASMEVTDQDVFTLIIEIPDDASMEATGQDLAGQFPVPFVSDGSVSLKGSAACNTDNQDGNDSAEIFTLVVDMSEDVSMEATDQDAAGLLPMSSASHDSVSLKELVACNPDNPQSNDSIEISDALMSLPCCNTDTLIDGDVVITKESAIPEQESSISVTMKHEESPITKVSVGCTDVVRLSTMTVAPMYEQKTSDLPIQSIVLGQSMGESHCPVQSEPPKDITDETIQEGDKNKTYMIEENTSHLEYQKMSMRELKKMLRNLKLDVKSNSTKEEDRNRKNCIAGTARKPDDSW